MEPIYYPRHLHKAGGSYLLVHNDEERDAGLAAGWSLDVPVATPVPAAEPIAVEKPKRGPGRPRKIPSEESASCIR